MPIIILLLHITAASMMNVTRFSQGVFVVVLVLITRVKAECHIYQVVDEGENLLTVCASAQPPGNFYWYSGLNTTADPILQFEDGVRGGTEYGSSHYNITSDGEMNITDAQLDQHGTYTLVIEYQRKVPFMVYVEILVTSHANCTNYTVLDVGDSRETKCAAFQPDGGYYWYRGSTSTPPILSLSDGIKGGTEHGSDHFDITDEGEMNVIDVQLNQRDTYTLVIVYSYGYTFEENITIAMTRHDECHPYEIVEESTDLTTTCASKQPSGDFSWYRGTNTTNLPILTLTKGVKGGAEHGSKHYDITNQGEMKLLDAQSNQAHTYTLEIIFQSGDSFKDYVTIGVTNHARCHSFLTVEEGRNVTTQCASFQPSGEYFWYRGSTKAGSPILTLKNGAKGGTERGNSHYGIASNGEMEFINAQLDQEDSYVLLIKLPYDHSFEEKFTTEVEASSLNLVGSILIVVVSTFTTRMFTLM